MVQRYEKIRKPHLNDLQIFLSVLRHSLCVVPHPRRSVPSLQPAFSYTTGKRGAEAAQTGKRSLSNREKKPFKQGREAVLSRLHRTCKLFAAGVRKSFGGRGKTLQRSPNACCAFANHNTKKSASNPDCRYRVCYRSAKIQKISRKCKLFGRFFRQKIRSEASWLRSLHICVEW